MQPKVLPTLTKALAKQAELTPTIIRLKSVNRMTDRQSLFLEDSDQGISIRDARPVA